MSWTPAEQSALDALVVLALGEDLGSVGDLTSNALLPADAQGEATFVVRPAGVVAGLPAAEHVFRRIDANVKFDAAVADGAHVEPMTPIARVQGAMRSILTAERTALNFLQRLSGIATLTRRYIDVVADLPCQILDTRKTTPGWRLLEKYAVRCGGGVNHRLGLHDGILIKDNHLAALGREDALAEAVGLARAHRPPVSVEVEVDTLEQLDRVLPCTPDIVLLDNMTLEELREAVRRRDARAKEVLLEASGGVTLSTLRGIAETKVDRISIGALTHSATALDIGLDYGR